MTGGDYVLDTSIAVAILRNDATAEKHLVSANGVYVTPVVAGELLYGAEVSSRPQDNRLLIEAFLDDVLFLECGLDVADMYARIKYTLRVAGRPIPDNDLWIAAAAMHHGLTLATRDSHFEAIIGLTIDRWEN